MRVLIIDDSIVMRRIVEGALRHTGFELAEVLHAANGAEGLELLETAAAQGESFDLILCDVHMPVLDGPGFLRELRGRNLATDVPVAMITADITDRHLHLAIEAGALGYIEKPFTLDQMRTRIASLLRHRPPAPPAIGGAP